MKQIEFFGTRKDGVRLYRQYSDKNCYLERDGGLYEDAVDPEGFIREYNETNTQIYIPPEMLEYLKSVEENGGDE